MNGGRWEHPVSQLQGTTLPQSSEPCLLELCNLAAILPGLQSTKLSVFKPFLVYIFPVPSTCAKDHIPSLIASGSVEELFLHFLLFHQLFSLLLLPLHPIHSSVHCSLAFTSTKLKLTPVKITLISRPLPLLTETF